MSNIPAFLKDAKDVLTEQGFATSNTWYHGTSSALAGLIAQQGLKRSGDSELKAAAKKTMATIDVAYDEQVEPVYLTQSKELAYYWAQQTVRERNVRIQDENEPVVFAVKLTDELNNKVKPDVGAASLLLLKEGESFMAFLAGIYQEQGLGTPNIDLMKADRLEYLNTLGMAYFDNDIDAACVEIVSGK